MKPPVISYARPETLEGALGILAEYNGMARVLAGGQSLLPLLNFRLANPEVLVDIAMIDELRTLEVDRDTVRIGASVTQRKVEQSEDVGRRLPLLAQALRHVGHVQIRNRGTVAGSIAHADPAAELPAVAVALEATMITTSLAGTRSIAAADFFRGPYETALEPGEMLTEVRFPTSGTAATSVVELSPRMGDFAIAGVAGTLTRDDAVTGAALSLFGVSGTPLRLTDAEEYLVGRRVDGDALREVAALATAATKAAGYGDVHAGAGYRARIAGELARRAVAEMAA